MKKWILIISTLFCTQAIFSQATADFDLEFDTVCTNEPFSITNKSVNNTTNYWNFSSGNLYDSPTALNINVGAYDPAKLPTRICLAQDEVNKKYYAFLANHLDSSISRLTFNGSYMDANPDVHHFTPTELSKNIKTPQGIQVAFDPVAGKWFGLIVNNHDQNIADGSIALIDFGISLDNNNPVVTIIDRVIGHLAFGQGCHLVKDQVGNWFFFVSNERTFVQGLPVPDQLPFVSRFSFGNTLTNPPIFTKLDTKPTMLGTNSLLVNNCVKVLQDNIGDWYGLVLNTNSSYSRIYFGNSLANVAPRGERLNPIANIGGAYEFQMLEDCNRFFVPTITKDGDKGITMVAFDSLQSNIPTSIPIASGFSNPHGLSEFYRIGDTLVSFVVNATTAEVTRIIFPGSSDPDRPSSTLANPPDVSYKAAADYNIRLTINEGTANHKSACKTVTVLEPPTTALPPDTAWCFNGNSITLNANDGYSSYTWLPDSASGQSTQTPSEVGDHEIILKATFHNCGTEDTFKLKIYQNPEVGSSQPFYMQVIVQASLGTAPYQYSFEGSPFNNDSLYIDKEPGEYSIAVRDANGCEANSTVLIERIDIKIPNYFTPNNDGNNDKWYLAGIDNFPDAVIKIYDRFGVVLATYSGDVFTSSGGWDGIYNGKPMPSNDYWYYVELTDGRKPYTGHITLIR